MSTVGLLRGIAASNRGQTGVDFVVGMGVFLVAVAFVMSFVPGMMTPFGDGNGAPMIADHVADELVYGALADHARPSTLDEQCTLAFFGLNTTTGCPFDDPANATDWLGVPTGYHLNVTVERYVGGGTGPERLCGSSVAVTTCTSPTDERLVWGEEVPVTSASVTTASRVVYLDGEDAVVLVRVW